MEQGKINVAVYGSLRRGMSNHGCMVRAEGDLVSEGIVRDLRLMKYCSSFPSTRFEEGYITRVEVYSIPADNLRILDSLEGYPSFYNRCVVPVELKDGTNCGAFVYFIQECEAEDVPDGDWVKYKQAMEY